MSARITSALDWSANWSSWINPPPENSPLTPVQRQILAALEIPVWRLRNPVNRTRQSVNPDQPVEPAAKATPVAVEPLEPPDWTSLRQQVENCRSCGLHQQRLRPVFGVGDEAADWLIIGEAPGQEEDQQGEPFVGRAGKLLDNMLTAIGLSRDQVYIANIVKCRPPGNRDPHLDEREACQGYLSRQIALLQPKITVALGRVAAHTLLSTDDAVGKLRQREFSHGQEGIPLVVTYHPAYLLRSPAEKSKVWDDLCFARERYNHHPSRE
ncbi:MAG: uracil-DNA glycosylase [Gammaproteobacteria bacterium]